MTWYTARGPNFAPTHQIHLELCVYMALPSGNTFPGVGFRTFAGSCRVRP
jgi:hypothetical protein